MSPLSASGARRSNMRWYPLLRRIAREVQAPLAVTSAYELDLLTRRLYAAYFHGHTDAEAWPPRDDHGTLHPVGDPDAAFVARLQAEFPGNRRLRTRLLGYLTIHGSTHVGEPAPPTVRCYLNVSPDAAPHVFSAVVAGLESRGVAFAAKLLDNPANFGRPDAAVFYTTRADASALVSSASAAWDEHAFGAAVPAFTREVAPGIAIADDPGDGVSFGYHRCALIAHGLTAVGRSDSHERLGAIIDAFLRAGIDPARPHLGAGQPEFTLDGAAA
ncbi:T3SS effector HopA1 family protein [Gryllotalpicola protaetiae]|nr:T3SS effector HopA1 family protein [Gryllotalpicola protaetiae]